MLGPIHIPVDWLCSSSWLPDMLILKRRHLIIFLMASILFRVKPKSHLSFASVIRLWLSVAARVGLLLAWLVLKWFSVLMGQVGTCDFWSSPIHHPHPQEHSSGPGTRAENLGLQKGHCVLNTSVTLNVLSRGLSPAVAERYCRCPQGGGAPDPCWVWVSNPALSRSCKDHVVGKGWGDLRRGASRDAGDMTRVPGNRCLCRSLFSLLFGTCHQGLHTHAVKIIRDPTPRTRYSRQKAVRFGYWVEKPSVVDWEKLLLTATSVSSHSVAAVVPFPHLQHVAANMWYGMEKWDSDPKY